MSWWYGDYSALLYGFVRGEEVKRMKKIDAKEMRTVEGGGASKYVSCPICGYTRKTDIWSRLFSSDRVIKNRMQDMHFKTMTGWNPSRSVH